MENTSTPGRKGRVTDSSVRKGGQNATDRSRAVRKGGKNRNIQAVEAKSRYWTDEVEDQFFAELAATCNVKASAAAVSFTSSTVYEHRKQRPEFAERWQGALEHGYARLEMALLEAANDSVTGKPWNDERPIPPLTADQVLKVLKLHHASVKLGHPARRGNTGMPLPLDAVKDDIRRKVRAIIAKRDKTGIKPDDE